MALRLEDEYVNADPASGSYPGGSFKNETVSGLKDGTPFEKAWPNDFLGFFQKLLDYANITPSGVPDTVLASDYFDSLLFAISNIYSALKNYAVGESVIGTDYNTYYAYTANGPSSSVVNPVTDVTGVWSLSNPNNAGKKVYLDFEPTNDWLIRNRVLHNNGASLLDADYPDLLAAWGGKLFGSADATHFYLSDSQGVFMRNWDNGAGNDPDSASRTDRGDGTTGDEVGTNQPWQTQRMTGTVKAGRRTSGSWSGVFSDGGATGDDDSGNTTNTGLIDFDSADSVSPNPMQSSEYQTNPINQYHFEGVHY